MVERRDHVRFDSEMRVVFCTTEFSANVRVDAYLMDCSRAGARVISPVYFERDQAVRIEIQTMKDMVEVPGKVIECREDPKQTYRFDRTFVVHVQFEALSDTEWNTLVSVAKKL